MEWISHPSQTQLQCVAAGNIAVLGDNVAMLEGRSQRGAPETLLYDHVHCIILPHALQDASQTISVHRQTLIRIWMHAATIGLGATKRKIK